MVYMNGGVPCSGNFRADSPALARMNASDPDNAKKSGSRNMPCCPTPSLKLLTIAILAVLPAISAYAGTQATPQQQESRQDRDSSQDRRRPRDSSSLSDAVRRIERNTRGEVLSAERVQYDGRDMHRVKVVDDAGRVRVFMQDPSRRDDNGGSNKNNSRSNENGSRGSQQDPRPARPARDRDD